LEKLKKIKEEKEERRREEENEWRKIKREDIKS